MAAKTTRAADDAAAKARIEAQKKKLADEVAKDEAWVNEQAGNLQPDERELLFKRVRKQCPSAKMADGKIVLGCKLDRKALSQSTYCSPVDKSTHIAGKKKHDLQEVGETEVDVALLNKVEDNYGGGYVPWGPGIRFKTDPVSKVQKLVATSRGVSGVTYGRGVDLGQINTAAQQRGFEQRIDAQLQARGMGKPERDAEIGKLRQFYAKKGADACSAFAQARANGTDKLDRRTVDALNANALDDHVAGTARAFEKLRDKRLAEYERAAARAAKLKKPAPPEPDLREFDELSTSEKTVLLSAHYQEGSLGRAHTRKLADAIMRGDTAGAKQALLEKTQLSNQHYADRAKEEMKYFLEENPPPPPVQRPGPQDVHPPVRMPGYD